MKLLNRLESVFRMPIFSGGIIKEKNSSNVENRVGDNRVYPRVEFRRAQEYYFTIPRVQNTTDSLVLDIINREWYFDGPDSKIMEDWESTFNLTKIFEEIIMSWAVMGTHIISNQDWLTVQMDTIISKERSSDGETLKYWQRINGLEHSLDAELFIETHYKNFGRQPWGIAMYQALFDRDFIDIDGKDPRPVAELHRQNVQDEAKIKHRLGSPLTIINAKGLGKEQIDNDLTPLIEGARPGDKIALNAPEGLEIITDGIEGNTRFADVTTNMTDEMSAGLQSSKNRLLTDPSAMADAREAGEQDDDRVLGIMKKLTEFMDRLVIPTVTGNDPGKTVFKWGAKDSFDLKMPEGIEKALDKKVISPEVALQILQDNFDWKLPDKIDQEVITLLDTRPKDEPIESPDKEPDKDPLKEKLISMMESLN